ncbi:endoplasmic reticulum transmembrane helix translocase-like [Artemia franciscana]|uniref:Manganese-transporting ATPase 13A1 n=1 Tax=Artemia franciscana TaxID=6661 RepID=A0AA88LBA3_ARTSF|nr:hypothetical protein QYM36_005390 [Artemia franciscana]
MKMDYLVKSASLYTLRPVSNQLHLWVFVLAYGVFFYSWLISGAIDDEVGLIGSFTIGILQIIISLFCFWSVDIKCFLMCKKEKSVLVASHVKVVPTANNGSKELVKLYKEKDGNDRIKIAFTFQKSRYWWNEEKGEFEAVKYPVNRSVSFYSSSKGFGSSQDLATATEYFGANSMTMDIPEFKELFLERATAPFFVFQVFCVLLWCLDAYWYYSVFTLFMLVAFEGILVQQQLRNMSEVRKMGNKPYPIQVYRESKWKSIISNELVAGDVVCVGRAKDEFQLVPCDMLLLKGSCIVDESMLTGESVPQMKESLETGEYDPDKIVDIEADGKLHVLFGGTKIVQHTQGSKTSQFKGHENGCLAFVLRTGFDTSQGKLLRTILFGVKRVTANNLETFLFILFLLIFAIAAAAYLWIEGSRNPERNRYKLFLECTLILTSVVPPELPIELSLAVNSSLAALAKLMVWCTEPFRIPFAGKIDICAFDKTGTLTTDALVVQGIAGLVPNGEVTDVIDAPYTTQQVLASCHALALLEDGSIIGDPLEKAALLAIDWHLSRGDSVVSKKAKVPGVKIHYRYHFQSALKRMTVIAGYVPQGTNESVCFVAVKGAPETLRPMFAKLPEDYDSTYLNLSRSGARVLALGRREIGPVTPGSLRDVSREELESRLEFVGFVVISCPLKKDSKRVISEILQSSHSVTMITGDNPLTACHVARELKFTRQKTTLILTEDKQSWYWESVHQDIQIEELSEDSSKSLIEKYDICLTGEGFSYLVTNHPKFLRKIIPHVGIFARVTPKQKEAVILMLKEMGYVTLMCGDGTNDVGALKHAHAGVAIISGAPESPKLQTKRDKEVQNGTTPVKTSGKSTRKPAAASAKAAIKLPAERPSPPMDPREVRRLKAEEMRQRLMKELEELEEASVVRLGDASIAAPFTSKLSSVECVCQIIKQGRCTLVTTLQMFKILALNALIMAYSQSVLYLEGVKFSDGQATLQGLLLAGCFLFISRSKPLKTLSSQRPLPNIFNLYTISTVILQFAVHFSCLIFLVRQAIAASPPRESEFADVEKEFEPNILNSTVYLISMALQVATIAVNYRGHPFMESLTENRPLLYALFGSLAFIFSLGLGIIPDVAQEFSIVDFEPEFRSILVRTLAADVILSFLIDRICLALCGEGRPKL